MEEIKKKMREDFRSRFGRFYVSIDSKTKAIRIVDIENGTKVNGEDGSLIECVASNDIEKFIDSIVELAVSKERERIVEIIDKSQGYECVLPEIDPSLGELTSRDIDFVKSKYGQIVFKKELINLINTK